MTCPSRFPLDQRTPRGFFYPKQKSRGFPRLQICIILVVLSRNLFDRAALVVADVGMVMHDQAAADVIAGEVDPSRHHGWGRSRLPAFVTIRIGVIDRRDAIGVRISDIARIVAVGVNGDIGNIFEDLQIEARRQSVLWLGEVVFYNHINLHDVDDDADRESYHILHLTKMVFDSFIKTT